MDQFDLQAAWLRLAGKNQDEFISKLTAIVRTAMPDIVDVRETSGIFGPKTIKMLAINFEPKTYIIQRGTVMPKFSIKEIQKVHDPLFSISLPVSNTLLKIGKQINAEIKNDFGNIKATDCGIRVGLGGSTNLEPVMTEYKPSEWFAMFNDDLSKRHDMAEDFQRVFEKI